MQLLVEEAYRFTFKIGSKCVCLRLDKDPQALAVAAQLEQEDSRFKIIHASFADLQAELAKIELPGSRWHHGGFRCVIATALDQAERGFSFMQMAPLDMRMDNSQRFDCGLSGY